MSGFNYRKAVQALNFFAVHEGGSINKMKAIKLVWLSNRDHLRRYGRPIFNDIYYAMKFGPVPSNTKDLAELDSEFLASEELEYRDLFIKPLDKHSFTSSNDVDFNVFSETDTKSLETTYNNFGDYTQYDLSELSHQFPEWKKFEKSINMGLGSRFEINIADFFKQIDSETENLFKMDEEDLSLSKEAYEEREELELI